ncbi:MAG TPA: type II toxin-antitoxin system HicB family antitoxin [Longimicrobiales bacterium]|nr:type II toxin-antitoxin system HicB family antitoxin [Longimicrobiales bacterium]
MSANYSARIFWSDEDGGYVAITPELEGVSSFGETPAAALSELVVARDLWLEERRASGHEAPAPLSLPRYSGQFRLRLPRSLHAWLAARAELEGVSLNTLAVQLLSEARGETSRAPLSRPGPAAVS